MMCKPVSAVPGQRLSGEEMEVATFNGSLLSRYPEISMAWSNSLIYMKKWLHGWDRRGAARADWAGGALQAGSHVLFLTGECVGHGACREPGRMLVKGRSLAAT